MDQIEGRKAKSSQNPQSACLKCQNDCNDGCKKKTKKNNDGKM